MKNIAEYLDLAVTQYRDKLAFSDGNGNELTFGELDEKSRRIGSFLLGRGLFRAPVALLMSKSPDEAAAFFGAWRAGAFYIPLDEEMPGLRLKRILERMSPALLIYEDGLKEKAEELRGSACLKDGEPSLNLCAFSEAGGAPIDESALEEAKKKSLDIDPAYVVFTSGSTGEPKGVAACHRSVIDYAEALGKALRFSDETVFASQTPFYFDACLKELLGVAKYGASCYLVPKALFMQPVKLVEYLNEHKVNTLCWVVSALTFISSLGTFSKIRPETLKTVAFGSEVFPKKQFALWKEALPGVVFYNLYGPTEATGMSCYYRLERPLEEDEPIPIGAPFDNTEVLLLKEDGTLAGGDEEGEICLRGTCVVMGYYGDTERTAAVFVQNPLSPFPETIYKTGDIGRRNSHGELVFVSRKDRQIKHMGHRIELGEIEAAALELEEVLECAAVYDEKTKKIRLCYAGPLTKDKLLKELKTMLPGYMLPNKVEQLEALPHLPNGKLDRKAL